MNGGKESAGDNTPETMDDFMDDAGAADVEDDAARLSRLLHAGAETAEWQATIQTVIKNVVSIRFCQTCSFDTDPALSSEATGFIVDAERGYAFRPPPPSHPLSFLPSIIVPVPITPRDEKLAS